MRKTTYNKPELMFISLMTEGVMEGDVLSNNSSFEPETNPNPDQGLGGWDE